jgi:hypothetical protein
LKLEQFPVDFQWIFGCCCALIIGRLCAACDTLAYQLLKQLTLS